MKHNAHKLYFVQGNESILIDSKKVLEHEQLHANANLAQMAFHKLTGYTANNKVQGFIVLSDGEGNTLKADSVSNDITLRELKRYFVKKKAK